MKLQFKIQQYQTDAVESVVGVFAGQPNTGQTTYTMDKGRTYVESNGTRVEQRTLDLPQDDTGYCNGEIALTDSDLVSNIRAVQTRNNIRPSQELSKKLGRCELDVEMETGTGKTYVYIKTMFELNKQYGWTKFIVVVPSIAIREGVKKSFDVTQEHYMQTYGKKARYFIYNSDNLTQLESYSQSADINVMIINTQAFATSLKEGASNKAARIIYEKRDSFGSRRPVDVIAANRPIIILDEPQKMGGEATQKGLKRFRPLFTLNYSATHKESHNPVYVLDALDAYNQKLVKRIEVVGFELKNLKGTDSYLYLQEIVLSKDRAPQARIEFEQQSGTGVIKRTTRAFGAGDSIYSASGEMGQYEGYVVTDIDVDRERPERSTVTFGNGTTMRVKDVTGNVTAEQKAQIQIRETIRAHFRKESLLFRRGIKCLSLFFIDEVANYRRYDAEGRQETGPYGKIFEEEYRKAWNENQNLLDPDYMAYLGGIEPERTHAGYFSIDKKGCAVNSSIKRGTDMSDDTSAYDLILKNKERLLSLDEPVRFIFSHSALREGWDNPNVFQICSLRQSGSAGQKRQEVGRGLRLCVDGRGVRQDSDAIPDEVHKINCLTVIASEAYADFAADLQRDIRQDLYDRPKKADVNYFRGKDLVAADGTRHTVTDQEAQKLYLRLNMMGYITEDGDVTDTFRSDLANGTLRPLEGDMATYTESVQRLVRSIFDTTALDGMIANGNTVETPENKLNANFKKREFQELWRRINHKYAYMVDFDSEELIGKAVAAIDKELTVQTLRYVVTRGEQTGDATQEQMAHGDMLRQTEQQTVDLATGAGSGVKYDLLGKIGAATKLTRRTVATILTRITPEKFGMFRANPEEFIRQVSRLIREQKATVIVDHISYNQLTETYDSDIFTQEKHTTMDKAYEGRKSIMDYVFTDGTAERSVERKFVENMDTASEVCVYAKLPKGFHIPTPVGNYSPDWAIAFEEGKVKHVYFVAETKGSLSSMDLRAIEKAKIACAERLFAQMSTAEVKYGRVSTFDDLMDLVR